MPVTSTPPPKIIRCRGCGYLLDHDTWDKGVGFHRITDGLGPACTGSRELSLRAQLAFGPPPRPSLPPRAREEA